MKYGITRKKVAHCVCDDVAERSSGMYVYAICGKWISPVVINDDIPEGCRICIQCEKKTGGKAT